MSLYKGCESCDYDVVVTFTSCAIIFFKMHFNCSSGIDVVGLVSRLPYLGEHLAESAAAAGATTFVIAYAVHKVFAPVRIGITLSSAPFIVRYLRSKGILKVKSP